MPHGHDCVEAEDLGESAEHRVKHWELTQVVYKVS